jgi:hypothetical protein
MGKNQNYGMASGQTMSTNFTMNSGFSNGDCDQANGGGPGNGSILAKYKRFLQESKQENLANVKEKLSFDNINIGEGVATNESSIKKIQDNLRGNYSVTEDVSAEVFDGYDMSIVDNGQNWGGKYAPGSVRNFSNPNGGEAYNYNQIYSQASRASGNNWKNSGNHAGANGNSGYVKKNPPKLGNLNHSNPPMKSFNGANGNFPNRNPNMKYGQPQHGYPQMHNKNPTAPINNYNKQRPNLMGSKNVDQRTGYQAKNNSQKFTPTQHLNRNYQQYQPQNPNNQSFSQPRKFQSQQNDYQIQSKNHYQKNPQPQTQAYKAKAMVPEKSNAPQNVSTPPVVVEGDWVCPNQTCNNVNWAKRIFCNRCETQRPNIAKLNTKGYMMSK